MVTNLNAVWYLTLNPLKLPISTPFQRCYGTLRDSKLKVIEESTLPSRSMIMAQNPYTRIVASLGEDSSVMLQVYQKVVYNKIMCSFQNASEDCPLGERSGQITLTAGC